MNYFTHPCVHETVKCLKYRQQISVYMRFPASSLIILAAASQLQMLSGFFSETSGVAVGRLLERVYVIFFAKQKLHKHLPCTQNLLRRKRRIWTHFAVTLLCAPEKYHIQTYLAQDI